MASICFPTTPGRTTKLGTPERAKPCRCSHAFVRDGGCEWCGRWTQATIRATWRQQAKRLATRSTSPVVVADLARYPKTPHRRRPRELAGVGL